MAWLAFFFAGNFTLPGHWPRCSVSGNSLCTTLKGLPCVGTRILSVIVFLPVPQHYTEPHLFALDIHVLAWNQK